MLGRSAHAMPHTVHLAVGGLCLQDLMGGVGVAGCEHGAACVCMFDIVQKKTATYGPSMHSTIHRKVDSSNYSACLPRITELYTTKKGESKSDVGEICKGGKQCMGPRGLDNYRVPSWWVKSKRRARLSTWREQSPRGWEMVDAMRLMCEDAGASVL